MVRRGRGKGPGRVRCRPTARAPVHSRARRRSTPSAQTPIRCGASCPSTPARQGRPSPRQSPRPEGEAGRGFARRAMHMPSRSRHPQGPRPRPSGRRGAVMEDRLRPDRVSAEHARQAVEGPEPAVLGAVSHPGASSAAGRPFRARAVSPRKITPDQMSKACRRHGAGRPLRARHRRCPQFVDSSSRPDKSPTAQITSRSSSARPIRRPGPEGRRRVLPPARGRGDPATLECL